MNISNNISLNCNSSYLKKQNLCPKPTVNILKQNDLNPKSTVSFGSFQSKTREVCYSIYQKTAKVAGKLNVPLTPYDTKEVLAYRKQLANSVSSTVVTDNINITKKLIKSIVTDIYKKGAVIKERTANVVLGLPGSGKSTLGKELAENSGALFLERDVVCTELVKKGITTPTVLDQKSADITDLIMKKVLKNGDNLTIQTMGGSYKSLKSITNQLKNAGYQVHLHLVDLPAKKAIERTISRYNDGGQFVDPLIPFFMRNKPKTNFNKIQKEGLINSAAVYSSDVPKGEPFKLVSVNKR